MAGETPPKPVPRRNRLSCHAAAGARGYCAGVGTVDSGRQAAALCANGGGVYGHVYVCAQH